MSEPTRLNIQWANLFPADTITIGDQKVEIKPMKFGRLASVVRELRSFMDTLVAQDITFDNYHTPDNLLSIATTLMESSPGLLAKAANLHEDDIAEMPLEIVVQVLSKAIEVNLKSKDSLLKNFKGLTDQVQNLMGQVTEPTPAPEVN